MRSDGCRGSTGCWLALLLLALAAPGAGQPRSKEYEKRVRRVVSVPSLAAFWDFMLRQNGQGGRFLARRGNAPADWPLETVNYVRQYWAEGREATYEDIPLLARDPFGNAVYFRKKTDPNFRPTLLLPARHFTAQRSILAGRARRSPWWHG